MDPMPLEKVLNLLGTTRILGSPEQLDALCIRIGELAEMNGEEWVRQNRQRLIDQWEHWTRP